MCVCLNLNLYLSNDDVNYSLPVKLCSFNWLSAKSIKTSINVYYTLSNSSWNLFIFYQKSWGSYKTKCIALKLIWSGIYIKIHWLGIQQWNIFIRAICNIWCLSVWFYLYQRSVFTLFSQRIFKICKYPPYI